MSQWRPVVFVFFWTTPKAREKWMQKIKHLNSTSSILLLFEIKFKKEKKKRFPFPCNGEIWEMIK